MPGPDSTFTSSPGGPRLTSAIVSDAMDRLRVPVRALDPAIRPLWPEAQVEGRALPIRIEADARIPDKPYDGEMRALEVLQPGEVPIFAVTPGLRVASWGELFSCAAIGRGARGAVVDGLVRDARQVVALGFPTFARGTTPLDTFARAVAVSHGEPCEVGGVRVERGDLIVGDVDGVVIVPRDAVPDVLAEASKKRKLEDGARADLLAGMGIRAVWEKYGVF